MVLFNPTLALPDSRPTRLSPMPYNLGCAIIGEKVLFPIKIDKNETVGELKNSIKAWAETAGPARHLTLHQVNINVSNKETRANVMLQISQDSITTNGEELNPLSTISQYYKAVPRKNHVHVLIRLPRGELIDPRVCGAVAWTIADMMFVPKFMSLRTSLIVNPQVSQSSQYIRGYGVLLRLAQFPQVNANGQLMKKKKRAIPLPSD